MAWIPKSKRETPYNLSITSKGSLVLAARLVTQLKESRNRHVFLIPAFTGDERTLLIFPASDLAPEALAVKTMPNGDGIVDIHEFIEEFGIEVAGNPPSVVRYQASPTGEGWQANLKMPVEGALNRV